MNARPLIAICGTTGVGKSNFAIELALHLCRSSRNDDWKGAKIINADAMQIYSGMDVITNKVPESERQGVEHLLMGFKSPGEQYVVGEWVQDALKAIDETHKRSEIPIVVGGTSYWIQHLMFPNRLAFDSSSLASGSTTLQPMSQELTNAINSLSSNLFALFNDLPSNPPSAATDPDAAFDLHTLLSILDPPVANRWHWRDTRKVLRSLCIIKESGRRASEIIKDQTNDMSANIPRFRTLCFWLYAEPPVLEIRLNERVDKMIEQGLLSEIRSLREIAQAASNKPPSFGVRIGEGMPDVNTDYTLGIYQSIGYKEFHDYLSASEPSEKAFKNAIEHMKVSTRQYAKRQISWIRNKLLPAVYAANTEETVTPTFLLDATELGEQWLSGVRDPGIQIMEDFLAERELPDPCALSDNARKMLTIDRKPVDPTSVLNARRKIICTTCTIYPDRPVMVEEGRERAAHEKTRLHRKLAAKSAHRIQKDQVEQELEENSVTDSDLSTLDLNTSYKEICSIKKTD
ncbi:tRNA dimethylallyltransferase, mitochondrial [Hypsizygus marmoreus]|uniref:tRNA dimethylallyltransferase, mitochondrial n=1 Tax=Hypsizygus marmoreus TaxID=39966 RepID=A0A369JGF5_HYPMA|nr:tRNA dimethylallyltransferase, mitochondrial [Hypsizygus marmoreus]